MRIEVTAQDIVEGERFGCYSCPIALALKRIGKRNWAVKSEILRRWTESGRAVDVPLPRDAKAFIDDFDHDRPVEPFSFDIELPT